VFAWLVHAERWPSWYSQCSRVRILTGPAPALGIGTRFRWTVLRVPVVTVVEECEPPRRLAWSGTGLGAAAYHSWDIEPVPSGCRVVTEETQRGAVPSLLRVVLRPLLRYTQVAWLSALARAAESGPPPRR
jgi:polyketide cyclase/dehydrase/lipid transport protein